MMMETNLDMNGHKILNNSLRSKTCVAAYFQKSKSPYKIWFNEAYEGYHVPYDCTLHNIIFTIQTGGPDEDLTIGLKIDLERNGSFTSRSMITKENQNTQEFILDWEMKKNDFVRVQIHKKDHISYISQDRVYFSFIFSVPLY